MLNGIWESQTRKQNGHYQAVLIESGKPDTPTNEFDPFPGICIWKNLLLNLPVHSFDNRNPLHASMGVLKVKEQFTNYKSYKMYYNEQITGYNVIKDDPELWTIKSKDILISKPQTVIGNKDSNVLMFGSTCDVRYRIGFIIRKVKNGRLMACSSTYQRRKVGWFLTDKEERGKGELFTDLFKFTDESHKTANLGGFRKLTNFYSDEYKPYPENKSLDDPYWRLRNDNHLNLSFNKDKDEIYFYNWTLTPFIGGVIHLISSNKSIDEIIKEDDMLDWGMSLDYIIIPFLLDNNGKIIKTNDDITDIKNDTGHMSD